MPYIHIRLSGEKDHRLAALVTERALELTSTLLGKERALSAVVIDFVDAAHWSIAGQSLAEGAFGRGLRSFQWTVSITDETNTKAQKAAYLAAVHSAMNELLGGVAEISYVHVADLRASSYGYGGLTQEYRHHHTETRR